MAISAPRIEEKTQKQTLLKIVINKKQKSFTFTRIVFLIVCGAIFLFLPKKVFAQVVINEFVPDASPEWVEFYNASSSAEYIKSYWLDDDTDFTNDSGNSAKKLLTDLNIANHSYPYIEISSFLNNSGDFVVLFDPGGSMVDQYQYTSNPGDNVSIGRNPDRDGSFVVLVSQTKGSGNSGPQPTPTSPPEPTATPQPGNTSTPTSTPTPKPPTPIPTKKPTLTPTEETTPTTIPADEVLGQEATPMVELTPTPEISGTSPENLATILPKALIGLGGFLLIVSGAAFFLPGKLKALLERKREKDAV